MPARKQLLEGGGSEDTISNPDKLYFPRTGHTKLDLVRYYLAVADGAVRGVGWPQIRETALLIREVLEAFGLVGWPKTSGSRGFHVYARIEPRWTFNEVRRAAVALAREVERQAPELATSRWWKEERQGVFIDYNQNAKDRTVASGYSVRPTPDARVSTPLRWEEVPDCEPEAFTIDTMAERFEREGDPWEGMDGLERWKARHAEVWSRLEPADVLVDSMRGRSTTWYRIRLNLRNVPEPERPPQEPLEIDYDPWAGAGPPQR